MRNAHTNKKKKYDLDPGVKPQDDKEDVGPEKPQDDEEEEPEKKQDDEEQGGTK